jgi:hypothetical protein
MSSTLMTQRDLAEEIQASTLPAVGLGLAGALVGALAWAALSVATNFEVGYVAVLVGFLAARGVKLGSAGRPGEGLRAWAAAASVIGLVAAKYLTVAYYAARDGGLTPFDGRVAAFFVDNLGSLLSPFDLLWVFLAVTTAWRVAAAPAAVPASAPLAPE